MGVASKRSAEYETIMPYDNKKDVVNYAVEDGKFYKAEPGTFFYVFFRRHASTAL